MKIKTFNEDARFSPEIGVILLKPLQLEAKSIDYMLRDSTDSTRK
jgi:hypothetical protein